jgi:uncharacterized membrane protein
MSLIKETQLRTITKLAIYRLLIFVSVFILAFYFTNSIAKSTILALIPIPIGVVLYYFFERMWLIPPFNTWKRSAESDSKIRSLIKTVGYRIFASVIAFFVAKIVVSNDNTLAAAYSIGSQFAGIFWYYVVERIFSRMQWGKSY